MGEQIEIRVTAGAVAGRALGGRPTQQDDMICLHDPHEHTCLLVLADGMGGHGAGETASRLVIETAQHLWHEGSWKEQAGALFLETLCQQAHQNLRQHHDATLQASPHSTVVCVFVNRRFAYWAHVGDSRLYRFQGRRLLGRTEDHSVTQHKIRRGELSAEQSRHDDEQHMLLQGLGGSNAPIVEHGCMPLQDDCDFVLCSDGVWAHLTAQELNDHAGRPDPRQALQDALTLVLQRSGEHGDNASLIFARLGPASVAKPHGLRRWFSLARQP